MIPNIVRLARVVEMKTPSPKGEVKQYDGNRSPGKTKKQGAARKREYRNSIAPTTEKRPANIEVSAS